MPRPLPLSDWQLDCIQFMARTGCSLKQAVTALEYNITVEECEKIVRQKYFQKLLLQERNRWYAEISGDPNFTKEAVIGKLAALAQKLEDCGDHDKAAEALFKIAKMNGWTGPESTISVFGELTQADLDRIREQVEKKSANVQ